MFMTGNIIHAVCSIMDLNETFSFEFHVRLNKLCFMKIYGRKKYNL